MEEYKQYETAPVIADQWRSDPRVGLCDYCGLDDAPIVINHPDDVERHKEDQQYADNIAYTNVSLRAKCKWCAEKDNLDYHLKYNGERRMIEINRTLNPRLVDVWDSLTVPARVMVLLIAAWILAMLVVSVTH